MEGFNGPLLFRGTSLAGCLVRSTIASPARSPRGFSRQTRLPPRTRSPAPCGPILYPFPADPTRASLAQKTRSVRPRFFRRAHPIPAKPGRAFAAARPGRPVRRGSEIFPPDAIADPPPHFLAPNRAASCPSCATSGVNLCRFGTSRPNGHSKRSRDADIQSSVLEIMGRTSRPLHHVPRNPQQRSASSCRSS